MTLLAVGINRRLLAGIASVLVISVGTFITAPFLVILTISAEDLALRIVRLDTERTGRVMRVVGRAVAWRDLARWGVGGRPKAVQCQTRADLAGAL